MAVTIILNTRSRANRRDPALADRMTAMLGPHGRVLSAPDLARLDEMTVALAADPPSAIAIHGGDGTLHKTLSSLLKAFGPASLPPIAILPGGTMNVVASSLGLRGRPEAILGQLVLAARAGTPIPTVTRHCLKIDGTYGFVFGNGLIANFLEEYYATEYGTGRALNILAHTFLSGLVMGEFSRRILRPFEGRVIVDGQVLPRDRLTGVGAATVREVGLGFKLNHRADDDPERFAFLAIHGNAVGLGLDLPNVWRGVGLSPKRALSGLGQSLVIEPRPGGGPGKGDAERGFLYTIDGDLYRAPGTLRVDLGPLVRFFKWN